MTPRKNVGWCLLASSLIFVVLPVFADGPAAPTSVRIGMVRSLFNDVPLPIVQFLSTPFSSLMKEFTGIDGKMIPGGGPYEVAKELYENKVNLAVFPGVEYAWVHEKYPELRPLMVAVNKHIHVQCNLVVRADSQAAGFCDLKGTDVAFPMRSKEHCRLFMERGCTTSGDKGSESFFKDVLTPVNVEIALDDLCAGRVQSAVIDDVSLETYQQTKPGCFARLKVLKKSEVFPAGVIVYRDGALDQSTLTRFREGMLRANKSEKGRDVMSMWKITSFENVPADYTQTLADIIKVYPAPEATQKASLN